MSYRKANIIEVLEEEYDRLLSEKIKVEKRMVPTDGYYLEIKKNKGKYVQYYKCKRENDTRISKSYLKKNELHIAKTLAQAEFDKRLYTDINSRLQRLQPLLKYYKKNKEKILYTELPKERKSLIQYDYLEDDVYLASWINRYRKQDNNNFLHDKYPIETPYYTDNGEHVRSKSEKIIADKLEKEGIPYVYEPAHELNKTGIHPDFVVLNINTRKTFVYEHFGMMDRPEYAVAAIRKIEKYRKLGYEYGENFLYTFETGENGFDTMNLEMIINKYWNS